ncbi:MAG: hypothetical protein ACLUHA_09965 [Bacteroides stercoris]
MSLKRFFILSLGILPLFFYGCDDDNPANADNAPKPEMDIMISPQSGLSYGDKVLLTYINDEKNQKCTLILKDGMKQNFIVKSRCYPGQSFQMNETFSIPLPKTYRLQSGNDFGKQP